MAKFYHVPGSHCYHATSVLTTSSCVSSTSFWISWWRDQVFMKGVRFKLSSGEKIWISLKQFLALSIFLTHVLKEVHERWKTFHLPLSNPSPSTPARPITLIVRAVPPAFHMPHSYWAHNEYSIGIYWFRGQAWASAMHPFRGHHSHCSLWKRSLPEAPYKCALWTAPPAGVQHGGSCIQTFHLTESNTKLGRAAGTAQMAQQACGRNSYFSNSQATTTSWLMYLKWNWI